MDENNRRYQNTYQEEPASAPPRRTRKRRRRRNPFVVVLKILGTILLVLLCTAALLACLGANYINTVIMPQTDLDLDAFMLNEQSVMYYWDRNAGDYRELTTLATAENSIPVTYEEIPKHLIDATIAMEDKRFETHHGVDWVRTGKAILNMFTGQDIQGGSTLTQQLIKNLTQYDDVTVKRKVIEIFKALELDAHYSKQEIITEYLNWIYLGSKCRGVGAASYEYFGKPVSDLDLAECASLISITNNPSIYNPYVTREIERVIDGEKVTKTGTEWNKYRQELVLFQMLDQGKITQEEYDAAIAEELHFNKEPGTAEQGVIYSWYEEQVINDVRDDLMEQYGYSSDAVSMLLSTGGLKIYTCVDPDIQAIAESVYRDRSNLDYVSDLGQLMQSAITVIDNSTGDVVAIVGSMGEKEANRIWSYAVDTKRQPGSSIKPLSAYSAAMEMGYITPYSTVDDYPFQVMNGRPWPVNDGAERYRGLTTVYNALTHSINTVAVHLIGDYVTPEASFNFVRDTYHITSLEEHLVVGDEVMNDYGLSQMALGGLTTGVNTFEMAAAYATFPNNGVYRNPRTYTRVLDRNGDVLLENEKVQEVALKESTAYYMNTMLQNVVANGTGTRARFSGMTMAGKTGTTSVNNDRWFVGYTPYYTAAVWTGYKTPERMRTGSINPATIMWKLVMEPVHSGLENKGFPKPDNLVSIGYCLDSGGLPTDNCALDPRGSRVGSGSFVRNELVPTEYCTLHTPVQVCTEDPILDADGNETGLYHLAGEFCPEESVITVALLDYDRENVGGAGAGDSIYLLSYTEEQGPCTVHTSETVPAYDPSLFDPMDPNTWPTDDPNFNILDPNTWPTANPGVTDPAVPPADPGTQPTEPADPGTQPTEPTQPAQPTQPGQTPDPGTPEPPATDSPESPAPGQSDTPPPAQSPDVSPGPEESTQPPEPGE